MIYDLDDTMTDLERVYYEYHGWLTEDLRDSLTIKGRLIA